MKGKSRHCRDESDPLLGLYAQNLAESSSIRNPSNPLYAATDIFSSSSTTTTPSSSSSLSPTKKKHSQDVASHPAEDEDGGDWSSERRKLLHPSPSVSAVAAADDQRNRTTRLQRLTSSLRQSSFFGHHPTTLNEKNDVAAASKNNTLRAPKKGYRIHRVSYTAQDHIQVLFRLYGSAFPNVFPFAVVNAIWCYLVYILKRYDIMDWTFHSSVGHSFMGLLVSFLIVSRSQISYARFMEYRKLLASSYRVCRELVQFSTIYTFYTNTRAAQEWRQEVSFRTILMLRVTMDALLWSSTERDQWEDEYYQYQLQDSMMMATSSSSFSMNHNSTSHSSSADEEEEAAAAGEDLENGHYGKPESDPASNGASQGGESDQVSEHFFRFRQLTHGRRSRIDETFRAPITFMHVLRSVIMDHPQYLGYKMAVNEYRDLLDFVSKFGECFHSFRVLVFTPYPFPVRKRDGCERKQWTMSLSKFLVASQLVQMTRGFLFFWVYTLPLVLLVDYRLLPSLMIITLVTLGFVGIEYVSMALDDPFADDTNDVDEHGMALLVYEDIYMALYRTDGPEAAAALRERVLEQYKQGRALHCYRGDLKSYDIWESASSRHNRLGPSPDWSSNPPPQPQQGIAEPTPPPSEKNSKSSKPRSRRRPPNYPSTPFSPRAKDSQIYDNSV